MRTVDATKWATRLLFLLLALFSLPLAVAMPTALMAPGTSHELARLRARQISNVTYRIRFSLPDLATNPIEGSEEIGFDLKETSRPVVLDFKDALPAAIRDLKVNAQARSPDVRSGHLSLPAEAMRKGHNSVSIAFTAGGGGFQRRDEFLYTLFVPNKASNAFPCFDQPDIKARFDLSLRLPPGWTAVAQGRLLKPDPSSRHGPREARFAASAPTSPYLFAFAAGKFESVVRDVGGRTIRLFHRESDAAKVARNLDAVFDLHGKSLDWLESYTGIPCPFEKFDFVLLPAFPFGGMEHPGSLFYSDKSILLDETATQSQLLDRAHLIAHETSHLWFGDLVTMRWFDDVWLKEVFANLMADKIVDPLFPAVDHDIDFLFKHYPSAYGVDRTKGANPIQQTLGNLDAASSLYGAIIYDKAPIALRQLEALVGPAGFRAGLRAYLSKFKFKNATWSDLLAALSRQTSRPLSSWSKAWIERAGRPEIEVKIERANGRSTLVASAQDPSGKHRLWPQSIKVALGGCGPTPASMRFEGLAVVRGPAVPNECEPTYILPLASDPGYGLFRLDDRTIEFLLNHLESIEEDGRRAVAWVDLWENLLTHRLSMNQFAELALRALPHETRAQTIDFVLNDLKYGFWALLSEAERAAVSPRLETMLWDRTGSVALGLLARTSYFKAYQALFTSDRAWENVHGVWSGRRILEGFSFAERDLMNMAYALALRRPKEARAIAAKQSDAIKDPERKREFQFVAEAAAGDEARRTDFFLALAHGENRKNEPWVLDALGWLHHPLHGAGSGRFLQASLDLLPEIKRTSGIFFPMSWMAAVLRYHVDQPARRTVDRFLAEHPDLEPGLRLQLVQAVDTLMRFTKAN